MLGRLRHESKGGQGIHLQIRILTQWLFGGRCRRLEGYLLSNLERQIVYISRLSLHSVIARLNAELIGNECSLFHHKMFGNC